MEMVKILEFVILHVDQVIVALDGVCKYSDELNPSRLFSSFLVVVIHHCIVPEVHSIVRVEECVTHLVGRVSVAPDGDCK